MPLSTASLPMSAMKISTVSPVSVSRKPSTSRTARSVSEFALAVIEGEWCVNDGVIKKLTFAADCSKLGGN